MEALAGVTVVAWLLGSADGDGAAELHAGRLRMLCEKLVDTPVRGLLYEGAGTLPDDGAGGRRGDRARRGGDVEHPGRGARDAARGLRGVDPGRDGGGGAAARRMSMDRATLSAITHRGARLRQPARRRRRSTRRSPPCGCPTARGRSTSAAARASCSRGWRRGIRCGRRASSRRPSGPPRRGSGSMWCTRLRSPRSRSSTGPTTSSAASPPRTRSGPGTRRCAPWPRWRARTAGSGSSARASGGARRAPATSSASAGRARTSCLPWKGWRPGRATRVGTCSRARSPRTRTGRAYEETLLANGEAELAARPDPDLGEWVDAARARWEGEGGQDTLGFALLTLRRR